MLHRIASTFLLYAYLDPDDNGTPVWQWALLAVAAFVVFLLAVYALTRFVGWAARR